MNDALEIALSTVFGAIGAVIGTLIVEWVRARRSHTTPPAGRILTRHPPW